MSEHLAAVRLQALLDTALYEAGYSFSIGTFGAVAEFHRDPSEPFKPVQGPHGLGLVTARGGIRVSLPDETRGIAFLEAMGSAPRYGGTLCFCLPTARAELSSPATITPLGPDAEAIGAAHRHHLLFDMGIGMGHIRACVRTDDRDLIAVLNAHAGRSVLENDSPAMAAIVGTSPHRVFISRAGRIEVFQGIPAPGTTTPVGPHTHVLPRLISTNRAFSANTPIPAGLLPVLNLHPPGPFQSADANGSPTFGCERAAQLDLLVAGWGLADELAFANDMDRRLLAGTADDALRRLVDRRQRQLARAVARRAAARGMLPIGSWAEGLIAGDDDSSDSDAQF